MKQIFLKVYSGFLIYVSNIRVYKSKIFDSYHCLSILKTKQNQNFVVAVSNGILYKAHPDPDLDLQKKRTLDL